MDEILDLEDQYVLNLFQAELGYSVTTDEELRNAELAWRIKNGVERAPWDAAWTPQAEHLAYERIDLGRYHI